MPQFLKDILPMVISSMALLVSFWSAHRSWRFNLASLRRIARNNYMTALFDINRQLITHPQLWAVYGEATSSRQNAAAGQDLEAGRRIAFIWYHLNLYETVYAEFYVQRLARLDDEDRKFWESWDGYVRSFLASSVEARAIVANDASMKLLNRDFVKYLRGCLHP